MAVDKPSGVKPLEAEELIPMLADIKETISSLLTAEEDDRRTLDSMYATLRVHNQNIGLLLQGYVELLESDDGRNKYLSSTLKEMGTKKDKDVYSII